VTTSPQHHYLVSATPLPTVPWLRTGNHWLSLPCIHPADGAIHAVGMLHRGARAAVEFAGGASFAEGAAPPLARLGFTVNGTTLPLARSGLAWERAMEWMPTFTASADSVVIRGTVFAPYGRDADTAGAVYAVAIENALGPRGVCLGGDDDPLPAGPQLTQHGSDSAFALAVSIVVRGVDEGETAIEGVTDGRNSLSLVHVVPVRVRHTAERARSQADARHRETV